MEHLMLFIFGPNASVSMLIGVELFYGWASVIFFSLLIKLENILV